MSFFIAFFPFDFECAKVQLFIGMAIVLEKKFYYTKQSPIYQRFILNISLCRMHWTDGQTKLSAKIVNIMIYPLGIIPTEAKGFCLVRVGLVD